MKDPLMRLAVAGALAVHVGVIAAGGALAPYLGRSNDADPLRTIQVGLETPEPPSRITDHKPQTTDPGQPVTPSPRHPVTLSLPHPVVPSPAHPVTPSPPRSVARADPAPREDAGGALNLGTPSERGDIEGLPSGQTPVGWVPGPDTGKGTGSGEGEGIGRPEPLAKPEPPPPAAAPEPKPALEHKPAPPPPRRVGVRVCAATRLRPNPHCPECISIEVNEGSEPQATCALHKPPPPPPPPPHSAPEPAPLTQPPPREEPPLTPARLVHRAKPVYPPAALDRDSEGSVSLKVEVRADGTCGDVEITRSSGSRILDAAAVKAVKHWRWEPAKRGGEPVASTTRCRIRFQLEE